MKVDVEEGPSDRGDKGGNRRIEWLPVSFRNRGGISGAHWGCHFGTRSVLLSSLEPEFQGASSLH